MNASVSEYGRRYLGRQRRGPAAEVNHCAASVCSARHPGTIARDELVAIDAWRRAASCLAVGQIYLTDNPLLGKPLRADQIKPRCWATSAPGPV
jgi:hypothetical protein